jgi:hypothetical protein
MGKNREKYFRCPKCGDLETKTGMMESINGGGLGMCYCEFDNGRTLIPYDEITKKEYNARLKEKELKK